MSASPAGGPGLARTPNGGPQAPRRRPPSKANPLNPRHKPSKQIQRPRPPMVTANRDRSVPLAMPPKTFAETPPSPTDVRTPTSIIPVVATKRALMDGLRFHIARLKSKDTVDIADETEYERPVKLHRKDPRYYANGDAIQVDSKEILEDDKERERLEAAKAERQRIREENQKQMAPAASTKKKPQAFKKKVEQVYRADDTPEARKRSQLRYEEALPWHLEDFTDKHVWQAQYEAPLSECQVMLMKTETGFRLVPLEKWYHFRQKFTNKQHMDVEKAEAQMAKGQRAPRWLLKNEDELKRKKIEPAAPFGLFARSGAREEKIKANPFDEGPEIAEDADDIDFNVDEEFADDEENELFEGDDDTKKGAEERLKRDQLGANVFDMNDEKEVDEEAEREKMLAEVNKKLQKGTKKALLKREKNYTYESDTEGNPYSSESESEDSDVERAKEEERKKEEEAKTKLDPKSSKGTKAPSGGSSRGANTPSDRKEKHGDSFRKATSLSASQKRPGSPNLSDASGNESSRVKRVKNNKGTSTPMPGDMLRKEIPSRTTSFQGAGAGSGSDTEAGRKPRLALKLKASSPNGTPGGSRTGSRAGSPAAAQPPIGLPTPAEILAEIPAEGISLQALGQVFKKRIKGDAASKAHFIELIRSAGIFNKETKTFHRKPT